MDSLGLFNTVAVDGTELGPAFSAYDTVLTGTWGDTGDGSYQFVDTAGSQSRPGVQWASGLTSGSVYEMTFTISAITGATQLRIDGLSSSADELLGVGTHTLTFTSSGGAPRFRLEDTSTSISDSFTLATVSVKEIHRRGIGVQMHGYMSYGDGDQVTATQFARLYSDANNYMAMNLSTSGANTGEFWAVQETGGTYDQCITTNDPYSPDVMVPFKIAGRFLDNALQGAADGVATTENTTPVGLPDLTGVDMEVAYAGPALHITKFNIFAENIPDSAGNFKMTQAFVEKGSS